MTDISITRHSAFCQVESLSETGADWLRDNVPEAGDEEESVVAYIDSPLYTLDIAEGATDDGLEVEIDGVLCGDGLVFHSSQLANSFQTW